MGKLWGSEEVVSLMEARDRAREEATSPHNMGQRESSGAMVFRWKIMVALNHRPQLLWRVMLRHPLPQEPTPPGYGSSHGALPVRFLRLLSATPRRGALWNTWTVVSKE
eukprot:jgi/Picre1/30439/NNA_005803.t1